jgi:hypothetical protein
VIAFPALYILLTQELDFGILILVASIAGFFLDWTRRGVKQPLVQNVIRPELRATAMALTEFFQGAVASVVIILFGNFADQYGLSQTLLILVCGFWATAFLVAFLYYKVYPPEALKLRNEMSERRELISE